MGGARQRQAGAPAASRRRIAARQEKVLVFTQFSARSHRFFRRSWNRCLGVPSRPARRDGSEKRQSLVPNSRRTKYSIPSCCRSKAGGAGLNLTAASHVVHFESMVGIRPVENQATDRAFRTSDEECPGAEFVCRGTLEEKRSMRSWSKQQMSKDGARRRNGSYDHSEMNNDDLLTTSPRGYSRGGRRK